MGFLGKANGIKSGAQQNTLGAMNDLPLQAKLRYGQPDDAYEQEADRVADSVVNNSTRSHTPGASPAMAPSISNYVQRQGGEDEKDAAGGEDMVKQKTKNEETGTTKKEEDKPVQMKESKEEERAVQKKGEKKEDDKPVQKKGEKKEEEKPVQKKSTDNKKEEKKVQKKDAKKEEEKPVQKKGDTKEEEKPVQKKESKKQEEKPVQKKGEKKEDEKPVQKKESNNPKAEEPDIEKQIMVSKSGGRPMHDDTRKEMGKQFGKDFRGVRIHNDALSYELCRKINAQAFTHGNHIYFAEGKYNPESTEGKRLLAHELTHVVQQGYDVRRKMIQKENDSGSSSTTIPAAAHAQNLQTGIMDDAQKTLTFDKLLVPPFKKSFPPYNGSMKRPKDYRRTIPLGKPQRDWKTAYGEQGAVVVRPLLQSKLQNFAYGSNPNPPQVGDPSATFAFKAPGTNSAVPRRVIGTLPRLITEFSSPTWNKDGAPKMFNVDHVKELQLEGQDVPDNMALVRSDINQRSGFSINNKMRGLVRSHLQSKSLPTGNSNVDEILNTYDLIFQQVDSDSEFSQAGFDTEKDIWKPDDIIAGRHFQVSNIQTLITVEDLSTLGDRNEFMLFPEAAGWIGKKIRTSATVYAQEKTWLSPWEITSKDLQDEGGDMVLQALTIELAERSVTGRSRIKYSPQEPKLIPVTRYPGAKFAGYIDKNEIKNQGVQLRTFSPVVLDDIQITNGVTATGRVNPTLGIIENAYLDFKFSDGEAEISKTFTAAEFKVPSPFLIDTCSLTLFASSERGLGLEGQVDFKLNNVGEGFVRGGTTTGAGFELEGEFNFDSRLFEPARMNVRYEEGQWTITGQIGIPQGKIRGIKRGTISITYENETLSATGEVEPDIKGIQRGNMSATFTADGFLISGEFTLSNQIPGIRGGNVSASLEKTGEEYKVSASGTAQPAIPGIDSQLSIEYDNGALKIEGEATYQRGILTGSIRIGATNRAVGADGEPTGDPTDTFIMYGGGEVTVRITPWLQGTVGVNFLPNGQMEVSGRIGIPSPIDVFPRKEIPERDIFSIGVDIPIFAIPLGPRSIGLKATIAGALKVYAGIGPGRLEQLELGITYNPDQPENTHITGEGQFVIPADAGLKLAVRASIGVDAGIAGVEGGIEVAGGLGLEATASAGISIDWTPSTGLELNADLSADVQPKFIFTIDGFIRAWVLFFEHEWRKRFVDYEYGSNFTFGVSLPIHYKEGEAFDISYEDIEFRKPDIDPTSFIGGLLRDIA